MPPDRPNRPGIDPDVEQTRWRWQGLGASPFADELREALEDAGIRVLQNEAVAPPAPSSAGGQPLHLVGVGPHIPAGPAAAVAQAPAGAPRLVIMHTPTRSPSCRPGSAPLTVAGHTHGGQLRLPFLPDWSYLALLEEDEVDGWIASYGRPGNHLDVSRGVGMSRIPARFNSPPELTLFLLGAAG